ncbi:MAG: DUF805 domain-containing protein [Xanthobacteraceae bacterium]|nr:DUF805 domain-containing protein [Xanthobacteraceae bacterium]
MSFGDAIGECFFNYANFRDRAARAEYWWWMLFATVVLLIALALDFLVFRGWSIGPFYLVFGLASVLPGLSVTVRRLHDTGRSGWWFMIPVGSLVFAMVATIAGMLHDPVGPPSIGLLLVIGLPIIIFLGSTILLLVWMCIPSVPGNNSYGPNRYAA